MDNRPTWLLVVASIGFLVGGCKHLFSPVDFQPGVAPEIKDAVPPACAAASPPPDKGEAKRLARRREARAWMVNLGKDGALYAVKAVGPMGGESASAVTTAAGDVVLVGSVLGPELTCEQPMLIVLAPDGHERNTFVLPFPGRLQSVLSLPDGGFLAGGQLADNQKPDRRHLAFISRLTASGEVVWTRIADGLDEGIVSIRNQGDHALVFGVQDLADTWRIRTDWDAKSITMDPVANLVTHAILVAPEGDLLLLGQATWARYDGYARNVPTLVRLGADGRNLRARTYFGSYAENAGRFETAAWLSHGEILAAGYLDRPIDTACLTRLNAHGRQTWSQCLPSSASIIAVAPVPTDRALVCMQSDGYDQETRSHVNEYELHLVWLDDKKLKSLPLGTSGAQMTVCRTLTTMSDGTIVALGAGKWLSTSERKEAR